jgi:hypothetical protein
VPISTIETSASPAASNVGTLVGALIWMAALVLPFTGIAGIGALGEMKGSASTYVLLAALPLFYAFRFRLAATPPALMLFMVVLWGWLAVSAAANLGTMRWAEHGDRDGYGKFLTSVLVLGFGSAISILAAQMLSSAAALNRFFLIPLALGVIVAGGFAVPELLSWVSPSAQWLYDATTGLFQAETEFSWRLPGRLSSVSFEAPDLSYYSAIVLPWLALGYRLARIGGSGWGRVLFALALLIGIGLLVLSNSRTGLVMGAAWLAAETVYWTVMRCRLVPAALITVAFFSCAALAVFLWLDAMSEAPPDDISTMSRLAIALAQFTLAADNPAFGVGWGQYGFHATQYLPSWAWESFEIQWWFEQQLMMPPSFSVPGRVAAELGVPGLLIWYGFWAWVTTRAGQAAAALPARSPDLFIAAAILGSAWAMVLGGVSNDCFRRPETWLLIGITAAHLMRVRAR